MNNTKDIDNDFLKYEISWGTFFTMVFSFILGGFLIYALFKIESEKNFPYILIIIIITICFSFSFLYFYELIKNITECNKLRTYFENNDVEKIFNQIVEGKVKYEAIHALGVIANSEAIEKLFEILFDFDEDVEFRDAALVQLQQIKQPEINERICDYLKSNNNKDDEMFFQIALTHAHLVVDGIGENIIKDMIDKDELTEEQRSEFIETLGFRAFEITTNKIAESVSSHISMLNIVSKQDIKFINYEEKYLELKEAYEKLQLNNTELQDEIKIVKRFDKDDIPSNSDLAKKMKLRLDSKLDEKELNTEEIERLTNCITNLETKTPKTFWEKPFGQNLVKLLFFLLGAGLSIGIELIRISSA